jgi:hypothetical protein
MVQLTQGPVQPPLRHSTQTASAVTPYRRHPASFQRSGWHVPPQQVHRLGCQVDECDGVPPRRAQAQPPRLWWNTVASFARRPLPPLTVARRLVLRGGQSCPGQVSNASGQAWLPGWTVMRARALRQVRDAMGFSCSSGAQVVRRSLHQWRYAPHVGAQPTVPTGAPALSEHSNSLLDSKISLPRLVRCIADSTHAFGTYMLHADSRTVPFWPRVSGKAHGVPQHACSRYRMRLAHFLAQATSWWKLL